MKYNKMCYIVKGTDCEGNPFSEKCEFSLIPPSNSSHYGTGYYMSVHMSLSGKKLVDVRYEKTTDIEILADRFMANWYGKNAHDICKIFPAE